MYLFLFQDDWRDNQIMRSRVRCLPATKKVNGSNQAFATIKMKTFLSSFKSKCELSSYLLNLEVNFINNYTPKNKKATSKDSIWVE